MANATWPSGLPQDVLQDGYTESQSNQVIRTPMESGPAKQRRRYRASARAFTLPIELDSSELDLFNTFFEDTLEGGSLPFDWVHPRTAAIVTFRFIGGQEIKWSATGWDLYATSFPLEIMP